MEDKPYAYGAGPYAYGGTFPGTYASSTHLVPWPKQVLWSYAYNMCMGSWSVHVGGGITHMERAKWRCWSGSLPVRVQGRAYTYGGSVRVWAADVLPRMCLVRMCLLAEEKGHMCMILRHTRMGSIDAFYCVLVHFAQSGKRCDF